MWNPGWHREDRLDSTRTMGHSAIVLSAAACLALIGCSDTPSNSPIDADNTPAGEVVVFAAASLTDVFNDIAMAFEQDNPEIDITLSFGGSSSLAVAVQEGAPADVLASANAELTDRLVNSGLINGPSPTFATNEIVLAVPTGEDTVTSLRDFERGELFLGACAAQVPCGAYADELFDTAGVSPEFDTRATDVRAVVSLLLEGELDAGIVYATDVAAHADQLQSLPLDIGDPVTADYPIAVLAEAPNPSAAQVFVDFVLGPGGQTILDTAGFGAP